MNLLDLPEEGLEVARGDLESGTFENLRLFLSESTITFTEDVTLGAARTFEAGVAHDLFIPSAEQTGLKIPTAQFTVDDGETVIIDFDANASVRTLAATGRGIIMNPVLGGRDTDERTGDDEEDEEEDEADEDETALQTCDLQEERTEEVLPGVTLTWGSSFLCKGAPEEGRFEATVTVANDGESGEAVSLDEIAIREVTPQPMGPTGDEAGAEVEEVEGLPLTVEPGSDGSFTVRGEFALAETDEGQEANIDFSPSGEGADSGEPFEVGLNVLIRGEAVAEE